jgi:hypothetical protein
LGAFGLVCGPLAIAGCGKTTSCCHDGCGTDRAWPPGVFAGDRLAVKSPLDQQAANGAVVYATLFNYHFVADYKPRVDGKIVFNPTPTPTPLLTPWGKEVLNRLARQSNGSQVEVYVQVASDVALLDAVTDQSGKKTTLHEARSNMTRERVQAVRDYLKEVRPDLTVVIGVSDPDPVGMGGREARTGYNMMLRGQPGVLSRSSILGAGIDPGIQASGDAIPPPPDAAALGGDTGGAAAAPAGGGGSSGGSGM